MIVHFNHHLQATGASEQGLDQAFAGLAGQAVESLTAVLHHGHVDVRTLSTLRIHLDWIHYRSSFRDPVIVRRAVDTHGTVLPLAEIAIDLRQIEPALLTAQLIDAQKRLRDVRVADGEGEVLLHDDFVPLRESVIWRFNRLFWQRLSDWKAMTGRGAEAALPGGKSDANHPEAVTDSVRTLWALLCDLEAAGQLPAEIRVLEIAVGSGERARRWLDQFKAIDVEHATGFYSRLQFVLGDFASEALDAAVAGTGPHRPVVRPVLMDAQNPLKALANLRSGFLYIHLTNVYDNLPFDELVRRDGRLYLVEARPYIGATAAARLMSEFGLTRAQLPGAVSRLLEEGPDALGARDRGMAFWRCVWTALRLEERLRAIDDVEEAHVPPGLSRRDLDDLLNEAPQDIRCHISRGAAESFMHTLPLLHPRGYLHVQDIFVPEMGEYREGFRGPGKVDGSLVAWVNGALLRVAAARAGYDVRFKPFPYRPGSRTTMLYTTQRA